MREKIAHRLTRPWEAFADQGQTVLRGLRVSGGVLGRRRVIAKIEWIRASCQSPIVTNLPMEPDWVVRFYQRGTAEQHIKEGKYAFRWTRLSCRKFRHNEVRLQLHARSTTATFLRCIELPEAMADWSLTSLQLADQDRRPRRPPRPRHYLPVGRGRVTGPMVGRPRHPPSSNASARMTTIHAQAERKGRTGPSAGGKAVCRARMLRVRA
ncbi:MAG: transposase [Paracoccaceae bacterium]